MILGNPRILGRVGRGGGGGGGGGEMRMYLVLHWTNPDVSGHERMGGSVRVLRLAYAGRRMRFYTCTVPVLQRYLSAQEEG